MAVFRFRMGYLLLLCILSLIIVIVEIIYVFNDEPQISNEFLREYEEVTATEKLPAFNLDENWRVNYSEENIYVDDIDRAIKNLEKPAAYAAKHNLPIIIWWTSFSKSNEIRKCGKGECYITEARKFQMHPRTRVFLFYGTSFLASDVPLPRHSGQEWGLFHEESPKNNPILHHKKTIELFNYTATFRRHSHFPLVTQTLTSLDDLLRKPMYTLDEKKNIGLAPVVFVQSACNPPSDRDAYIYELMKYIPVDSYGACLHNKDLPIEYKNPLTMDEDGFHKIIAKYKFTLAFENAICEDYITEKLWRPLVLGSVPIYKGSPSVNDWMPNNNSVILVDDFKSPRELAEFIKYLDQNDVEYLRYLKFKQKGITNERLLNFMKRRLWGHRIEELNYVSGFECFVCDSLHENIKRQLQGLPKKTFFATQDHYGCPRPEKYNLPAPPGVSDNDERDIWQNEYDTTKIQSDKLFKKVHQQL